MAKNVVIKRDSGGISLLITGDGEGNVNRSWTKPDFEANIDGNKFSFTVNDKYYGPFDSQADTFFNNQVQIVGTTQEVVAAIRSIFFLGNADSIIKIHTDNTLHPLTGTLAQTVLFSFTILAGKMGPNSSLHILWTASGNAGNTRYTRIRIGGVVVAQGAILGSNTIGKWYFTISNRGVLNSQIAGNSTLGASTNTGFGASTGAPGLYNIDFSQDVLVEVLGDLDVITDNIAIEHFESFIVP